MASAPLVVLVLLLGMAALGAVHARRVTSGEDFALAGRGLGAGILTGTLVATWVGTGSIFGNAEFTYTHGVAGLFLPLAGLAGMVALAVIAPRVRRLPAASVPGVLGLAFGRPARVLGAIALIGAYLIIVSYQYRAGAAVAERLFPGVDLVVDLGGAPRSLWPVLCALFVILYTALAGLLSVATTDLVAGVVIAVGVVAALGWTASGWDAVLEPLPAALTAPAGGLGPLAWIGLVLPPLLLILGDANLMQRFLAARTPATARRAAWGAFFGLLVVESAIVLLALVGRARLGGDLANPAHVVVDVAFELVPPVLGLALVAAIVAVVLSTADSFLLACSTTATADLLGGDPARLGPARQRLAVVAFGLVALAIAYTSDAFFRVALFAYTIYGVTITPAFAAALFRPRTRPRSVVLGMGAGLATAIAWKALEDRDLLADLGLDAVLPALAANVLAMVLSEVVGGPAPAAGEGAEAGPVGPA